VSLRRATGQAAFAGDFELPGLLHLALRRSPHARARVASADASFAQAIPGVAVVLTAQNAPGVLSPELRFVGDRVAAAAAEDAELARRAVEAIRIGYEPLPPSLDAEAAAADPARVAARLELACGDVEAALAQAELVVDGEWRVPFTPAIALEPPVATTWLDEDRRLVVRTSAESPFRVRGILAERLSLPAARVRVVRPLVAGGSAGRSDLVVEDLCASVTLRTGRPARLALSAGEELTTTPGRPAQRVRLRLGLAGGQLTAIELGLLVDLGADAEGAAELLRSSARHALALYAAPALRVEALAVHTNRPPASAPRGADAAAALALECAIDEAAARLGEEPAAFRRRQLRRERGAGTELLAQLGEPAGSEDSRAAAELLAAPDGDTTAGATSAAPHLHEATGVALARRSSSSGSLAGAAASLRLLDDGSFHLAASHSSAGGTDEAVYVQAAAAILTVPSQRIVAAAADTDSAAFEAGEPAPTLLGAGLAVEDAARQARERILEAGAGLLGIPSGAARVEAGAVCDESGRQASFAEIGAAALRAGRPITATASTVPASSGPSFASARAAVAVDVETGIVHVRRLSATLSGGAFPDPRGLSAIVEGALAMAVEQALAGGLPFDGEGRPLVRSFRTWPLVAPVDVPPLEVLFVTPKDATARVSSAALGDTAGRAALAAIVNAVARAVGGRVRSLPLTPAVVFDALGRRS
jgi:putative selenate reductase molybdopterin-binding subunit